MKDHLCALCGGELELRTETLARQVPKYGTILIKDVPVRVCTLCGHRWLGHDVMKELQSLADGRRTPDSLEQVPVYLLT